MQIRRFGHRLDQFKAPAVVQRRNFGACRCNFGRIDLSHHYTWLGTTLREDAAPRIDDQRMAECLTSALVLAALCGRKHKTAVLNGACA